MSKSCFNCRRQYNCPASQEGYSEYIAEECEDYVS